MILRYNNIFFILQILLTLLRLLANFLPYLSKYNIITLGINLNRILYKNINYVTLKY